jgi:drug/metabolite transporter superfamily protein YnfA
MGLKWLGRHVRTDPNLGRTPAAGGGVFLACSLGRGGVVVERFRPDSYDPIGAGVCLVVVAVILYASCG